MRWLILRQYRTELAFALPVTVALFLLFVLTGRAVEDAFRAQGVSVCLGQANADGDCLRAAQDILAGYDWIETVMPWMNFLPIVIGVLAGAPLVLEFDQRTYRLAWTQGVGRSRWFLAKLVAAIALGLAAAALVSFSAMRMYDPIARLQGRWGNSFNFELPVFLSYTLFALALVVGLGVWTRKALPTFLVALVLFVVVRVGIENVYRDHYLAPKSSVSSVLTTPVQRTDWVLSQKIVDAEGKTIDRLACRIKDPNCAPPSQVFSQVKYQPAGRFWTFQGIESGIFVALSAALLAGATYWVSRRML
jgi:hypothetical protein